VGGFLVSNITRMPTGLHEFLGMRLTVRNLLLVIAFAGVWRLIGALVGLYDPRWIRNRRAEAVRVITAVTAASVVALVFPLISRSRAFGPDAIAYYWTGSIAGMLLFRACLRALLNHGTASMQDVLIVGSGPRALSLYREVSDGRAAGYRFLGFVDSQDTDTAAEIRAQFLGDLDSLEELLMRHAVDQVLIALPARSRYGEIQRTIEICERGGVPAKYLADVFQHQLWLENDPFTAVPAGVSADDPRLVVKRCLDVVLGTLALVVALPVLAAAALAIKVTSPGSILFTQDRYGLNKRRFKMYKLRTMVTEAEAQQDLLEGQNEARGPVFKMRQDPRLTKVGGFLRRSSIDELPQLVNVLRGEMSLVGPRPLPIRDVSRFDEPALMRRFSVYPGITGLWQVSGRSALPFDRWIELDLEYIDDWSLLLDLRILCLSLPAVIRGTGAM